MSQAEERSGWERVRPALQRVRSEATILEIGGGIALGLALIDVADQAGALALQLAVPQDQLNAASDLVGRFATIDGGGVVEVGSRAFVLGPVAGALVTLAVVFVTLSFVIGRSSPRR